MCRPVYQDEVEDQIKVVSKEGTGFLNSFRVIFPTVEKRKVYKNEPCFHKLNNTGGGSDFVVSSILKTDLTDRRNLVYLKYVMEESPFRSVFMNTFEEAVGDSTVVVTSEAPSNLMVGGLVCTRYLWEFPHHIRLFNDLVDSGIEKGIAFLFLHFFNYSTTDSSQLLTLRYGSGGHEVMDPLNEEFDYCKNYLEDNPKSLNPLFHVASKYSEPYSIHGIWRTRKNTQDSLREFIHSVWKDALSSKNHNTPCLNPFKKAIRNNASNPSGPYEDVIKLCVEHLVPAFKEKIFNDKL